MNIRYLLMLFVVSTFLFAIDKNHNLKEQVSIMDLNNSRPVLVEDENAPLYQSSREEIDLWFDDLIVSDERIGCN